jgi:hypothetical protein
VRSDNIVCTKSYGEGVEFGGNARLIYFHLLKGWWPWEEVRAKMESVSMTGCDASQLWDCQKKTCYAFWNEYK